MFQQVKLKPTDSALRELDHASQLIENAQEAVRKTPQLSVIIPAYNESETIRRVVDSVLNLEISKQIIVVDDGSTDGTQETIRAMQGRQGIEVVFHLRNQGKGAAIQTGIRLALGFTAKASKSASGTRSASRCLRPSCPSRWPR